MTISFGNVPSGATLYIPFASYGKTNGESITLTGLATTDIEIYKNGSATTRASDNGYTLLDTDGIDFAGKTGIHGFSIDLSDNSDSGFYAVGSQYWVVVASVTVDSQTVNFVAATFRIVAAENSAGTPVVDMGRVSGTTTPADNLETVFTTINDPAFFGHIDSGTAQQVTGTTLRLQAGFSTANNNIVGAEVFVYSSTLGKWQTRPILSYNDTTKDITVDTWNETPNGTIKYIILATAASSQSSPIWVDVRKWQGGSVANPDTSGYPVVTVKDGIGAGEISLTNGYVGVNWADILNPTTTIDLSGTTIKTATDVETDTTAILDDTNELQTDWANGGRLDLIIDAILADTAELQTDWADGGRLDLLLDAIPVGTEMFTTQLTESYAADGAAPTAAQALFAIQQFLQEKTISGTTLTVKKLDGTTTAMTFTLSDATTPASVTRAT